MDNTGHGGHFHHERSHWENSRFDRKEQESGWNSWICRICRISRETSSGVRAEIENWVVVRLNPWEITGPKSLGPRPKTCTHTPPQMPVQVAKSGTRAGSVRVAPGMCWGQVETGELAWQQEPSRAENNGSTMFQSQGSPRGNYAVVTGAQEPSERLVGVKKSQRPGRQLCSFSVRPTG